MRHSRRPSISRVGSIRAEAEVIPGGGVWPGDVPLDVAPGVGAGVSDTGPSNGAGVISVISCLFGRILNGQYFVVGVQFPIQGLP